jgi:hypothetical protein
MLAFISPQAVSLSPLVRWCLLERQRQSGNSTTSGLTPARKHPSSAAIAKEKKTWDWSGFFFSCGYRNQKKGNLNSSIPTHATFFPPFLDSYYGFPLDFLGSKHAPSNLVIPPIEKQPASVRFPCTVDVSLSCSAPPGQGQSGPRVSLTWTRMHAQSIDAAPRAVAFTATS